MCDVIRMPVAANRMHQVNDIRADQMAAIHRLASDFIAKLGGGQFSPLSNCTAF
jgi:hypothetical protein